MNKKITFSDLVQQIAEKTGASETLVHDCLIECTRITKEGLLRDGQANLRGIGRFRLKWHETRSGRNPQTGEEIEIPAHSTVNYKAEKDLREFINRNYAHLKPELLALEVEKPAPAEESTEDITEPESPVTHQDIEPGAEAVSEPPPVPARSDTVEDSKPDEQKTRKSPKLLWAWILLAIIILILAIVFWPKDDSPVAEKATTPAPEGVAEVMPEDTESSDATEETNAPEKTIVAENDSQLKADQKKPDSEKPPEQAADPAAITKTEKPETKTRQTDAGTTGITQASHQTQAGDNLWKLASTHYGQSELWPNIYRVNKSRIMNPDLLIIGETIQVPGLEGKPGSLTQNDLADIGEGFIQVYFYYAESDRKDAIDYLWVSKALLPESKLKAHSGNISAEDRDAANKIDAKLLIR